MNFFKQLIMLVGLVAAVAISSAFAARPSFEDILRACQEATHQATTMSGVASVGVENARRAAILATCKIAQDAYGARYQNELKEAAHEALERGTIVENVHDGKSNLDAQLTLVREAIYKFLSTFYDGKDSLDRY